MRPTLRLPLLLALLAALAILAVSAGLLGRTPPGDWRTLWWGLLALLGLASLSDALWLWRTPTPEVRRHLPAALLQGRWSAAQLELRGTAGRACRLLAGDLPPPGLEIRHLPQRLRLAPGATVMLHGELRAAERGLYAFAAVELLLESPLGLWQARRRPALAASLRVLPDSGPASRGHLPGAGHVRGTGQRPWPRQGPGREFHQLREFRDGDSLRQIDWKATARKRQPVAREYQEERDQQILFLLDGGQRMRSRDGERSHFDRSLQACLRLAGLALQQGDAVGVQVFGSDRPCRLPPAKGPRQLRALTDALYDLQPGSLPGDWSEALGGLLAGQRRQALIILISNLQAEDADELPQAARHIATRHRLLIASLRETLPENLVRTPVVRYEQALAYCAALDFQAGRHALHARLAAQGLAVLDVAPEALDGALIERYLQWKHARGRPG